MKKDLPISTKILSKRQLSGNMFSITLDISVGAAPGQFVMLWDGAVDELPISVCDDDGKQLRVLIGAVGEGSRALVAKEVGEYVGVRGAYGKGFNLPSPLAPSPSPRIAMVAGGYGVAPLYFFSKVIKAQNPDIQIDFFLGARSKDLLLITDELEKIGVNLFLATNDGSVGVKGFVTDSFMQEMSKKKYDLVATVGPEIMMKKVADACLAASTPCQVSIERFMKCGIGLCAACCVDNTGERMCKEGPVVSADRLDKIPEFGKYHRNAAAQRVDF